MSATSILKTLLEMVRQMWASVDDETKKRVMSVAKEFATKVLKDLYHRRQNPQQEEGATG